MNDKSSLERTDEIGGSGATHPRVSLADIMAAISEVHYINPGDVLRHKSGAPSLDIMTICVIVMANGFVILGKSAPASPENYDVEKGRTFAYEDAVRQIWPLMAFSLRERLTAMEATAGEQPLAPDVQRLVIAAREAAFGDHLPQDSDIRRELDAASEVFASRVGWDNDPNEEGEGDGVSGD